jgi:TctA family transporter
MICDLQPGYRFFASKPDCWQSLMVGCRIAVFIPVGIRSHTKVVAAQVLPLPVGAALVLKCILSLALAVYAA